MAETVHVLFFLVASKSKFMRAVSIWHGWLVGLGLQAELLDARGQDLVSPVPGLLAFISSRARRDRGHNVTEAGSL